jgi:hypothetical protein
MRVPRVRFTVRWMMVTVVVVASLLAAERSRRRSGFYRKQAAVCACLEVEHWVLATDGLFAGIGQEGRDNQKVNMEKSIHYKALKERYRRVSRRPWEALPPGTPVAVEHRDWDYGGHTASEVEQIVNEWYARIGPRGPATPGL